MLSKHMNLQEFPPKSNLDTQLYGNQGSKITWDHIKNGVDGLTLEEVFRVVLIYDCCHSTIDGMQ